MDVAGVSIVIDDLSVSGVFAPDASYIGGVRFGGAIDTRSLVDLIVEGGGDDAVCELVAGFGVECVPCGSDGEPYCLGLLVVDIDAPALSTTIDTIEFEDCHEQCENLGDNPECPINP